MPAGMITSLPPSLEWAPVHLTCRPIRTLPPSLGSPLGVSSCPTTVRRDTVPPPLPPALRSALPSLATCAPPAPLQPQQQQPQPNYVRVAGGASSAAGPLGSPHHERFNLVLPASFVECNFILNNVLQRGVTVAFRVAGSASAPASAPASSSSSAAVVARVHGVVRCHVNPLGLTTYRVSGPQPAAVCGCSLLRWAAEDGCLVIELAVREQQQQAPTPVAARRLFGDCLPSPATIRKEPMARTRALAEQRYQPSPLKPQQPQHQQAVAAPAAAAAAGYQLPAPLPFSLSLAEPVDTSAQQLQAAQQPTAATCTAAAAAAAASAFVAQQAAAADILVPQPQLQPQNQVATEAKQVQLRSHNSDPGPRAAAMPARALRSRAAAGTQTQQQHPQPAAILRSKRLADKAAAAAAASAADAAPQAAAAAPKRHRRTASAEAAVPSDFMEAELSELSVDEQHVDELSGIELLLAAHVVISRREQQHQVQAQEPAGADEAGRPKRMRLQKTLSL